MPLLFFVGEGRSGAERIFWSGVRKGVPSRNKGAYPSLVATYRHVHRAEPKEPTHFGSVSGWVIQNLPFSHSGIVSLYRSEQTEPTYYGSVSGSEIQNICIGRNIERHPITNRPLWVGVLSSRLSSVSSVSRTTTSTTTCR